MSILGSDDCEDEISYSKTKITRANHPKELMSNQSGTIPDWHYEWFTVDFDTWAPNHLHWDAPSTLHIMVNGDVYVTAAHMANMRKTWVLDGGKVFVARIKIDLYQEKESTPYSFMFPVISLNYKQEANNVETRYHFPALENVITKFNYIGTTQSWDEGQQLPPPGSITLPPITFP